MPDERRVSIGDFLTDNEIEAAIALYQHDNATFHNACREQIVKPALERINKTLGQQNDPDYLVYVLEYAFMLSNTEKKNATEFPRRPRSTRRT